MSTESAAEAKVAKRVAKATVAKRALDFLFNLWLKRLRWLHKNKPGLAQWFFYPYLLLLCLLLNLLLLHP